VTLLPGAVLDPGAHWNGEAGWSSCLMEVWHYTVGRDSRALIRDQGLAAVLVWDGVIWQFAPLEAVCFTECEWNRRSIGIEVESLDGSLTPGQVDLLGYVTLFCLTTFGIPDVFYDGPRLPLGTDFRGVTNHRNLVHQACDQHYDGFDVSVWDEIHTAPAPEPDKPRSDMASFLIHETRPGPNLNRVYLYDADADAKTWIRTPEELSAARDLRTLIKFDGGYADDRIHEVGDNSGLWGRLLDNARDADAPTGGGSSPGPLNVTLSGTAIPA
jgi:hypothetical protein